MPGRITPLVNNQIYHVFNRGIDHRPTFTDKKEFERAMIVLSYYRFSKPPMRLSYFLKIANKNDREEMLQKMAQTNNQLVEIICFCLMPNHFHFLIRQLVEYGISKFLSNLQNSYTRYFNIKNNRTGPLFLDQFKALLIETDGQFLHVSRYIHLNPLTSYVVKDFEDLKNYQWSSFADYLGKVNLGIVSKDQVLGFFKDSKDYEKFILDQADYQRELHKIKHLTLDP